MMNNFAKQRATVLEQTTTTQKLALLSHVKWYSTQRRTPWDPILQARPNRQIEPLKTPSATLSRNLHPVARLKLENRGERSAIVVSQIQKWTLHSLDPLLKRSRLRLCLCTFLTSHANS